MAERLDFNYVTAQLQLWIFLIFMGMSQ